MANEMEVCDMSKKLIMGAVMALALVVCIPQTASAKTKWKLSATSKNLQVGKISKLTVKNCQTAHCGRYIPHFDFGAKPSPIVPYRHLPQSLSGMTADCRSLV